MSQVRIGVIGLGMMGRHHGRLCQSLDVFDFVGAVDPQGDQYGVIHQGQVFSDTESLLKEGIEAAVIAVSGVSGADATESGTQSVTITINENE